MDESYLLWYEKYIKFMYLWCNKMYFFWSGMEEEALSGVSGDLSLYRSGPLFSPLKEPLPLGEFLIGRDRSFEPGLKSLA